MSFLSVFLGSFFGNVAFALLCLTAFSLPKFAEWFVSKTVKTCEEMDDDEDDDSLFDFDDFDEFQDEEES